ncbi:XRE family transcriptional regulator [Thermosulfidibacter takaii ABI70S6]|uniref:XRE family transcriptional regulator n=1 Tax=Thermosulfidibacter takaii (strain DSM 17441 / JCM 13301 / NBRC 103674 / ABI70S6) TaxID=1298851 RepID=A0A0S3QT10_THET7|nr:XRE family transcriptional regulator [Thermosulfidibacter takaii]BAT71461.1 XRE family transcriptional regulator [Thermosulfidibacter takaii ABI70S6]
MRKKRDSNEPIKELNLGGKIRDLRLKRGYTLRDVSQLTGFSTALLSQIENNVVSPPISTLWKIAEALGVKIGYFFQETPQESVDYTVVKKGKGKPTARRETYPNLTFYSLAFGKVSRKMDPYIVVFDRDEKGSNPVSHEGEEFIYVLEGNLKLHLGDKVIELEEGDSVYYDSRISHFVEGKKGTKFLAVVLKTD